MDKEKLFDKLENFLKEIGDAELPKTLQVTFSYSTGEKDIFIVSEIFWANAMVATRNRKKYLYYQNNLINLEHVVKMQYEKIDTNT
ncbi:hypothetical protein ACIQZG_21210 [Lysinibacillus sp. NPDC096418]|uniref:hypothetical protein n=1 Tax=Lysinibacillus sp. NPDC096418 TaxID=3364138 RepID=UPI0037F1C5FB